MILPQTADKCQNLLFHLPHRIRVYHFLFPFLPRCRECFHILLHPLALPHQTVIPGNRFLFYPFQIFPSLVQLRFRTVSSYVNTDPHGKRPFQTLPIGGYGLTHTARLKDQEPLAVTSSDHRLQPAGRLLPLEKFLRHIPHDKMIQCDVSGLLLHTRKDPQKMQTHPALRFIDSFLSGPLQPCPVPRLLQKIRLPEQMPFLFPVFLLQHLPPAAYVLYERRQHLFHLTVGHRLQKIVAGFEVDRFLRIRKIGVTA